MRAGTANIHVSRRAKYCFITCVDTQGSQESGLRRESLKPIGLTWISSYDETCYIGRRKYPAAFIFFESPENDGILQ